METRTYAGNETVNSCSNRHGSCQECTQGALFSDSGTCSSCLELHYITCDRCEERVHEDRVHHSPDNESLCDECFFDDYEYCSECGCVCTRDEVYATDDHLYCQECFDKHCFICAECENTYEKKEHYLWRNENGDTICDDCYQDYYTCSNCGDVVHSDNVYFNHNDDPMCYDCYNASNGCDVYPSDIPEYNASKKMTHEELDKFYEFQESWREEFIPCVAEFYTIQLMKELERRPDGMNFVQDDNKINFFNAAYHAMNLNAVDNLHVSPYWNGFMDKNYTREAQIIHDLKKFFMDYIFIACIGEARNVWQCSNHDGFIPEWLPIDGAEYCSRDEVWTYGYYLLQLCKNDPENYNFKKLCDELYRVFDENDWTSSYGGAKWANIIGHLCRYMNGEMRDLNFVDLSISLVHNGSLFVDKIGVSVTKLKRLLDLKFAAQTKDLPEVMGYIKTVHIMGRYEDAYKWACEVLGLNTAKEKPVELTGKPTNAKIYRGIILRLLYRYY